MSRVRHELSARAALEEQRRVELRRRLRPEGVSLDAVARSLDWPGGEVGVRQVLRELAERGEAHERDGLLFAGPDPRPPASRLVITGRTALPRPPWLAAAYARGAEQPRIEPSLSPEALMESTTDVLRRQIVDYVTNNPGAKVSAIAKFVEAERELVSRLLVAERNRGVLRLEGSRAQSRWFRAAAIPSSSSPPPIASRGAPASSSVEEDDPAHELALVDQVLDGLGIPPVHRLARIALLAAHGARMGVVGG